MAEILSASEQRRSGDSTGRAGAAAVRIACRHASPAFEMTARLELTRSQILAFRRRVGALDERLPHGRRSLERAAWAGLQDSMPRAALLSIHARVEGTQSTVLGDPALVQVWGPRFSVFVVAERDRAVFSLGRLPEDVGRRAIAEDLATRLDSMLDGRRMGFGLAGRAMGVPPNRLRYAAPTGRVLLEWDGARQPIVWTVPAPDVDPGEARRELARRYLHIFGPATPNGFSLWAGIEARAAARAFESLSGSLSMVHTPIGEAWILTGDEQTLRSEARQAAPARLLPSGDAYFLLQGADRELLVPDASRRDLLWTPRVWPGAVLVEGEIVGTWRRARHRVTIETWRKLSDSARGAVEAEAASLPLPEMQGEISVRWD